MVKNNILNVAISEFGARDYSQVSLDSIIRRSDIGNDGFCINDLTKERLYISAAEKIAEERTAYLKKRTNVDIYLQGHFSVFQILINQIQLSMDFARDFPEYALFCISAANETSSEVKEGVKEVVERISVYYFNQLIDESIMKGILYLNFPYDMVSQLFSYMINYFIDYSIVKDGESNGMSYQDILKQLNSYMRLVVKD